MTLSSLIRPLKGVSLDRCRVRGTLYRLSELID